MPTARVVPVKSHGPTGTRCGISIGTIPNSAGVLYTAGITGTIRGPPLTVETCRAFLPQENPRVRCERRCEGNEEHSDSRAYRHRRVVL